MILIGNPIRYSFVEDFTFNVYKNNYVTNIVTPKYWPTIYNGYFVKYNEPLKASGIPYEMFIMNGLNPDASIPTYIDHNYFHVYVKHINMNTGAEEIVEYRQVNNLILDSTFSDFDYELYLNERKNYIIKFGDDIHGKKLMER